MLNALASTNTKLNIDFLMKRMYETLLANGAFLHKSYNVKPVTHRLIFEYETFIRYGTESGSYGE